MKELDALNIPLDGVNLIEASAGTGKTYTIVTLFLRLLLEEALAVEHILVVTFTTAATEELKNRLRKALKDSLIYLETGKTSDNNLQALLERQDPQMARRALTAALRDFDTAQVFTIHGFCRRMLSELAFEAQSIFDAHILPDQAGLQESFILDFLRRNTYDLDPLFLNYAMSKGFTPQGLNTLAKKIGPDTGFIPQAPKDELEPAIAQFKQKLDALPSVYDRTAIEAELAGDRLNARTYKPQKTSLWLDEIEIFLRQDACYPLPEGIKKFSVSSLETGKKAKATLPSHAFFDACEDIVQTEASMRERFEQNLIALKLEFAVHLRQAFPELKQGLGVMSFDDLLITLRDALQGPGGDRLAAALRKRLKAALIDEFQDTDPVQYAVFSAIFGQGPLFLIGDPKQAIYSFRGADIFTYLGARRDVHEDRIYTLSRNWRSVPALVQACNAFFGTRQEPFAHPDINFLPAIPQREENDSPQAMNLWFLPGNQKPLNIPVAEEQATQAVAAQIIRLITQDDRQASDMAVLVRKNAHAVRVRDSLAAVGIPSVMLSEQNVLESPEAGELATLLSAILRPANTGLLSAALATRIMGRAAEEIYELMRDEAAWGSLMQRFRKYHERWQNSGFLRMFREFLEAEEVIPRLVRLPRGERRITNLSHVAELLHIQAHTAHLGPEQLINRLMRPEHENAANTELRLESDENAVRIITVHKSKGLEFHTVFCPLLWSSSSRTEPVCLYHDEDGRLMADLGSTDLEAHRSQAARERLAEDMRLLYVALTRARESCYIAWGRINRTEGSSLNYLLHDGASHKESSDAAMLAQLHERLDVPCIAVQPPPQPATGQAPRPPAPAGLKPRSFTGRIPRGFRIASFTGLSSGAHAPEIHDNDETVRSPSAPEDLILPAGAATGIMLHTIFEQLDYTRPANLPELTAGILQTSGFDPGLDQLVINMVHTVINAPLDGENLRLADISLAKRFNELEFTLPLAGIRVSKLARAFAPFAPQLPEGFTDVLHTLDFEDQHGFLRGFIDLVFEHQGRFYLIDWKSNFLGPQPADYNETAMEGEMRRSLYTLQYYIYLVALHRYLSRRLPGYDYETHMGSVFYVFLRGVDATGQTGIHRARPTLAALRAVEQALCGEPHGN